jgi:hypothetical protein
VRDRSPGADAGAPSGRTVSGSPTVDGGVSEGQPPPVVDGNGPCVLSADCPTGQHCDLGECYQQCNVETPCDDGQTCSSRGRCLDAGKTDSDPAPVTTRAGTIRTDTTNVQLTERDDKLRVHLISDAKADVSYRVEVNAPYLSLDALRGSFNGDVTLELGVDATAAAGKDLSGSVRVVTSLGNVVLNTPMRSSVTGSYQGALAYDGVAGGPQMGATQIGLDVSEKNGNLVARFVPERSLLFAPLDDRQSVVSGTGSFTYTDGVDVVMRQVIPAGFAGTDDLFNRDIGREVRLHLAPGARGALDGTFTETIYGLLVTPLSLTGHAHLERMPCNGDAAACAPQVPSGTAVTAMPKVDPKQEPDFAATFPGWSLGGCTDPLTDRDPGHTALAALEYDAVYHQPFLDGLSGDWPLTTADPIGELATACEAELKKTSADPRSACAQIAPLACSLATIDANALGSDLYDAFGTLYAHVLDVPLFVAQNDLVVAVKESFVSGFRAELERLEHAKTMLHAPAQWVMHPRLLEYLRVADPKYHTGGDEAPTSLAARTLSRFLFVRSTIDAEEARIDAGSSIGTDAQRRQTAQKKGLEALLEAATLYSLASSWKSVPPELGAAFVDVLTPMDAGFSALTEKAGSLGVADGEIPNVYEPGRKPTNFEQLLDIADSRIQAALRDETSFTSETRQFEDDEDRLADELGQVVSGYETQIKSDCGDSFDLTKTDWSTCGKNDAGIVGSKLIAIEEALARMQSAESRVEDKAKAVKIEQDRIAAIVGVREGTIEFTLSTGEKLKGVDRSEAELDGMEKALEIASQASVWNGGAPLAEAIGAFAIADAKGELEASRQDAQTAQDMQVQEDALNTEKIQSAATVKGLLVDMAQAKVEAQEDVIGVLSARVDAENALADAKRQFLLRGQTLARIGQSSLRDPTARILQSRAALNAIRSRADAQTGLLQAGRGLEYYLNHPIGDALGDAVLNAYDSDEEQRLRDCFQTIFDQSRVALAKTEAYVTDVSVRKLLGIDGPRKDDVTGAIITEGEQLRQVLLQNQNLDGKGGVAIGLSTTLDPGNQLWSSNVCDDRITQVEAQLVGDFLGDNEAEVHVELLGGGVLRKCDGDGLMSWSTSGHAVLQSGVNTFGTAPPNDSLHGLAVASSKWQVSIPGASDAPSNADLDLTKLEDIVLRIHHEARPIPDGPAPLVFDCLGAIGGG